MSSDLRFVDRPEDLAALAAELEREPIVAIDSEFIREKTYVPKLEIVQIATRDGRIAIVDYGTLGGSPNDPLGRVLAAPGILKVFHAAEQDLEMLHLATSVLPAPIWDTQLVTGLFGYVGRSGYTSVVQALLGERATTGEALTDWSRRPLHAEQLRYAAEDVRYLIPLYDAEQRELEALGRVAWAEEECRAYRARVEALVGRRSEATQAYQRIRGWGRLDRRGLAILRELAVWRESEAARRNRPSGTVVRDDLLVEVARRKPERVEDLATLRGFHPRDLDRMGPGLVRAVEVGRSAPKETWPELPPPSVELEALGRVAWAEEECRAYR
ncbi:MAG: ribonuclease D, partial [Candidatus Binatia bacterium]